MPTHPLSQIASQNFTSTLDASLALSNSGLSFFPCMPHSKQPYVTWSKITAVSEAQAREWHKVWPNQLIGLHVGQNGLFVVDLDKAKKSGELDGEQRFKEICWEHDYDPFTSTLCAESGSGGKHIYYIMPKDKDLRNTSWKLGQYIDTRGNGGYIIIPPSKSEKGQYVWLNNLDVTPIPQWLLSLLLQAKEQNQQPSSITSVSPRKKTSDNYYNQALQNECDEVSTAPEGQRNYILNNAACKLGHYVASGNLDEEEVITALTEAATRNGLQPIEIQKTIASGLKAGKQNPKEKTPLPNVQNTTPHNTQIEEPVTLNQNNMAQDISIPSTLEEYNKLHNAKNLIADFLDNAETLASIKAISTGYENLDALLDDGLYAGLYTFGAITSLGKTTFVMQMVDAIAKQGHDVLIFSMEMSKNELMSKSLSRITLEEQEKKKLPATYKKTARDFLKAIFSKYTDNEEYKKEIQFMLNAFEIYNSYAENIYIIECCCDMVIKKLVSYAKNHVNLTGKKPVIIVDYLQILTPWDQHASDKQINDYNIVELKRLSRDLQIPVIVVSSFNRENYKSRASLQAFKESGAIEYTSDVLIGLQLEVMKDTNVKDIDSLIEKAKAEDPRKIELLLLKNRHGKCGNLYFEYYPAYNYFKPVYKQR